MKKPLLLNMCLLFCLGLILTTRVEAQKGSPSPVIVTSTIQDSTQVTNSDGSVSYVIYRIQSDLMGSYLHGTDSVISRLQSSRFSVTGDFELDITTSIVRTVSIDLTDPVPGSVTNPPFDVRLAPTRFITKCYQYTAYKTGFSGMKGLNSQISCPMAIGFLYGGQTYRLYMNPFVHGETNMVRITCTGVAGDPADTNAPCNRWNVEPSATVSGEKKNIAQLLRVYTARGKEQTEELGDFYISFNIGLTNP